MVQWGDHIETLRKVEEETGIQPKALKDKPTLAERWQYARSVFDELSGSRQHTFKGPARIPISEYQIYAVGHGFTKLEWLDVWEDLSTIDSVWLSSIQEKKQNESKKGT